MFDSLAQPSTRSPWLRIRIDHRFQRSSAAFHLLLAFEAHADRTVVFGPSGSGKSSLLRAIAGLLNADAGRIELHGEEVWRRSQGRPNANLPTEKRRVGLVMQSPAVFPHLTVARNVAFPLHGMEKQVQREKAVHLLRIVDAEALVERWPRQLSGGQLQRVAIARTLAAEPRVLLLDEPFSALDARSRQKLSESVQSWARDHRVPILAVTHNLEEAFASGEEVVVIEEGRVCAQGEPREILAADRERLLDALGAAPAQ